MHSLDMACFEPAYRFSRGAMKRFAEDPRARVVVAECGERMAGFAILHVEEEVGYVVTLDVAEEFRRQGVARTLMQTMEREAWDEGCVEMSLHVAPENEAAIRFYEREGYLRTHTAQEFYGAGLDAWVYRKAL